MSAIIINSDNGNLRILAELARKLGGEVTQISDTQLEDLALGFIMDSEKTRKSVNRAKIIEQLSKKNEG
tara:strand:+ start:187 stop:393 length:207 start_codon:yes stop_codon:yes gene_type:complete